MEIETIGVVGSGTMGSGIAQTALQHGFKVRLYDIDAQVLSRGVSSIFARLERLVEKGRLSTSELNKIKPQLDSTISLEDLHACQLIIEAAPEVMQVKQGIFKRLDDCCPPETIMVTNTSSFSITKLASMTKRVDKIAGLHFFNPAPVMKLVEVIQGLSTSSATMQQVYELALKLNKKPVICQDTPGFIVNRVARPFYNEALRIMSDKLASVKQIDRIMEQAGNFKMGPFELQDLIGIDINYSTTESIFQEYYGDPRFRPQAYQKRMVQSGNLGRKAGRGYYSYE